jgi:hypothetical protein
MSDGYAPELAFVMPPAESVQIMLTTESIVPGRVVNHDDEPVPGMRVKARPLSMNQLEMRSTETDEDGEFTVKGLVPGAYQLSAEGPHARGLARAPVRLDLGQTVRDVSWADSGVTPSGQTLTATLTYTTHGSFITSHLRRIPIRSATR